MRKPALSASFEKRQVEFLWFPFIQKGTINMLTGGPGTGKSTITCDIAAALSVGRPLPGEDAYTAKKRGIVKTWILNAEDDPNDTLVWRLDNQKADRTKIWLNSIGEPLDDAAAKEMFDFIRAEGIGLVVVDPVQAWIGADTDMYRPNHVRAWGSRFKAICEGTQATFLWVRHRRKGDNEDHSNINSGLGSIDFSGIVRSEIGAVETKNGCKITRIKGNVGRKNDAVYYDIHDTDEVGNIHGQLSWTSGVSKDKPEKNERKPSAKRSAVASWVIGMLSSGASRPRKDIVEAARRLGYSPYLVEKALTEVASEDGDLIRLRKPGDGTDNDAS